jgi:hypothetical protein
MLITPILVLSFFNTTVVMLIAANMSNTRKYLADFCNPCLKYFFSFYIIQKHHLFASHCRQGFRFPAPMLRYSVFYPPSIRLCQGGVDLKTDNAQVTFCYNNNRRRKILRKKSLGVFFVNTATGGVQCQGKTVANVS